MARGIRKRRQYYSQRQMKLGEEQLREQICPQLEESGLERPAWEGALVVGAAVLGLADRWSDFNSWYLFGAGRDSTKLAEFVTGLQSFSLNTQPYPGRRWRTPTFSRISWLDRREARSPWVRWDGRTAEELGVAADGGPFGQDNQADPTDLWWLRFGRVVHDPQGVLSSLQKTLASPPRTWNALWFGRRLVTAKRSLDLTRSAADSGELSLAWAYTGELAVSCLQAAAVSRNLLVPPAHHAYWALSEFQRTDGIEVVSTMLGAPNVTELLRQSEGLIHWAEQRNRAKKSRPEGSVPDLAAPDEQLKAAYEDFISKYFPHAVKAVLRDKFETASILLRAATIGFIRFAQGLRDSEPLAASGIMRRVEQMAEITGGPAEVVWAQIDLAQTAVDVCCDRMVGLGLRDKWFVDRLW